MHQIKKIFREIKKRGWIEDLKELSSIPEKLQMLNKALTRTNISKESLSFYSSDEQLYLSYLIQKENVDLGLCPHFYIFFSGKNQRFHYICKLTGQNQKTSCCGEKSLCTRGLKNKNGSVVNLLVIEQN